jgi:hypothetical protein
MTGIQPGVANSNLLAKILQHNKYDDNNSNKKRLCKSSPMKGQYKAIIITYTALTQDFDRFLPTVTE